MNIRSIIIVVAIVVVLALASLYFVFFVIEQPEEIVQQGDGDSQGDDSQTAINEKKEEIRSRITYPNSSNDTTVNISYDFKQIPNDYSANNLMNSLQDDVNSF